MIDISYANGPGKRTVIWLQGCNKRCKDCYNPEMWSFDSKVMFSAEDLTQIITQNKLKNGIEGITLSGGEPLLQASQLLPVLRMVKETGLSILCYTGFDLDAIPKEYEEFLKLVDVLISGPYISSFNSELFPLVGSSNKNVKLLTKRYNIQDFENVRIEILLDDTIEITGFPPNEFIDAIKRIIEPKEELNKS